MDSGSPSQSPFPITLGAAAEAADDARRRAPRLRTLLGGKLVFGAHDLTADCAVRNLTEGGAKIQTSVACNLPREFWLIITRRGMAYRCALAWRRDDEVGVRFISEHVMAKSQEPELAIVRHVWREIAER